jgi:hypothetical protein
MKDLSEVLANIERLADCKDPNDWIELDDRRCDYCAEVRKRIHICECWTCGAPFGYCKCPPPPWKQRMLH